MGGKKICLKSKDVVVAEIPNHPCVFEKNTKENAYPNELTWDVF
jgi:hypothetical protein